VLVAIVNDAHAQASAPALDALLEWVYQGPREGALTH
jgi:hypothetical protein